MSLTSLYNAILRGPLNQIDAAAVLDLTAATYGNVRLPNSGVMAGVYGDSSHLASITVDASGRVTAASQSSFAAGGTVTSFSAGNFSPLFTTSVATATSTPALTFSAVSQAANLVFAGPSSGAAAAPTFRALVLADLPAGASQITSIALAMPGVFTVAGSPLTSNGTITVGWNSVLGDILYADAANSFARLAGNTSSSPNLLYQTGTGTVSAAPAWATIGTSLALSAGSLNAIQDIRTTATPQFARLGLGAAADASIPLNVLGPSANYTAKFSNQSTAGNSFGLLVLAGTNSSDWALSVVDKTNSTTYLGVRGDGVIVANNTTDATAYNAASVVLAGGLGVAKSAIIHGYLGVGVSSPAISGTGSSVDCAGPVLVRGGIAVIQISAGVMEFAEPETRIRSYGATAGSGVITFRTGGGGGSNDAEAARVTAAGNFLIGTTSETGLSGGRGLSVGSTTDATSTSAGALVVSGGAAFAKSGWFGGPVVHKNYTVATLPAAASYSYGIAFITDATLTAITGLGLTPTGGGTNIVPVYSDGTNWRII